MATKRQIGQELKQNARRGPNLSVVQRDQIIGMLNGGCTVKEVAAAYGRTDRCIRKLRLKYHQTVTTVDKPRSGRPPILSLSQKKNHTPKGARYSKDGVLRARQRSRLCTPRWDYLEAT